VKNSIYKIYQELIKLNPPNLPLKFDQESIQQIVKSENYREKFEFY